jgi:hypothetical protein
MKRSIYKYFEEKDLYIFSYVVCLLTVNDFKIKIVFLNMKKLIHLGTSVKRAVQSVLLKGQCYKILEGYFVFNSTTIRTVDICAFFKKKLTIL